MSGLYSTDHQLSKSKPLHVFHNNNNAQNIIFVSLRFFIYKKYVQPMQIVLKFVNIPLERNIFKIIFKQKKMSMTLY